MIVNVRMKDGRTTFQFASRKDFLRALGQNPAQDGAMVRQVCWVKHNVHEEEEWRETTVAFINQASVAFVLDANTMEDFGIPAQETANERLRKFEERESEGKSGD